MAKGELEPGQTVGGKYRVDRILGRGGMGIVVAATDAKLDRQVAIKALLPALAADHQSRERFLREARAAVRLTSEHTVRVFDVGELLPSGTPYMAMEFLVGRDLEAFLGEHAGNRIPSRDAVDLLLQAIEGLAEAHAIGIVHRDLKPANLFMTRRTGRPFVKILDFGLAKSPPRIGEVTLTGLGAVMGTHQYMSPEQLRQSKDVDRRTDIWALGVCLYQMTTGRLPFDPPPPDQLAGTVRRRPRDWHAREHVAAAEISRMILNESPPPPHALFRDVPIDLSAVIMRCLEKDPSRRFVNVAELAEALEKHASRSAAGIAERVHAMLEADTVVRPSPFLLATSQPRSSGPASDEATTEKIANANNKNNDRGRLPLPAVVSPLREAGLAIKHHAEALHVRLRLGWGVLGGVAMFAILAVTVLLVFTVQKMTTPTAAATMGSTSSSVAANLLPAPPPPPTLLPPTPLPVSSTDVNDANASAASASSAESSRSPQSSGTVPAPPTTPASSPPPLTPSPSPSAGASTSVRPPLQPNPYGSATGSNRACTPPYTFDAAGKKHWKLECL